MKEFIIPDDYIIGGYLELECDYIERECKELIHCEDCIYYDGHYCHNKWWGDGYGNYTSPIKSKDGHCDWAERRGEE